MDVGSTVIASPFSTVVVRLKEGTEVAEKKEGCHLVDVVDIPAHNSNFDRRWGWQDQIQATF